MGTRSVVDTAVGALDPALPDADLGECKWYKCQRACDENKGSSNPSFWGETRWRYIGTAGCKGAFLDQVESKKFYHNNKMSAKKWKGHSGEAEGYTGPFVIVVNPIWCHHQ